MRRFLILTLLAAAPAVGAAAPTTTPATMPAVTLKWDEAAKHIGETATVTGPVMGTHVTTDKKSVVLNVGADFPDKTRFTVLLPYDEKAGEADDVYKGKKISVTGKIVEYKKLAEIKAKSVTIQK